MERKISGIYLVVFDHGVKIGISDDIHKRVSFYLSPWNRPIRKIYYLQVQYPRVVEYKTMNKFKTSKKPSEFITLNEGQKIEELVSQIINFIEYNRCAVKDKNMFRDFSYKRFNWIDFNHQTKAQVEFSCYASFKKYTSKAA